MLARGDKTIAKDPLARKTGNHLADHAHAGQDHDVNRGVRVEPEEMLKQHRIAPDARIENTHAPDTLHGHEQQGNGQHRRGQDHDEARRIERPAEERQAEPGQARRAHLMDRDHEIQPGDDGGKAGDKYRRGHGEHMPIRVSGAVRRIECPPRIHSSAHDRHEGKDPGRDENIPTQQVQLRERPRLVRRSSAGAENFPDTSGMAGTRKNQTMRTPWMVKSLL